MLIDDALARRIVEMQEREGVRVEPLDAAKVPAELHALLPYAQLLGVGDDGVRGDIGELLAEELADTAAAELIDLVTRHHKELAAWLDSQKSPHSDEWSALWCLDDVIDDLLQRREAAAPPRH